MRRSVLQFYERSEKNTKDTCVAKHIHRMLVDEEYADEFRNLMMECESPKTKLLWEIFFETGIRDTVLLEERIYQYGSMVKTQDYFGRELFLWMVSLLNHLKNRE